MTSDASTAPDLPCRDVVEVITAYLDGALDGSDRRRLEAHLAQCEDCAAYVEQIRVTIAGTERSAGQVPPLPDDVREGARRAFRGWVA